MLPDFLKTKAKLKRMIHSEMKKTQLSHLGPVADAPKVMIFEGNKSIIIREDCSVQTVEMKEARAEVEIKLAEVETMSHETVLDKSNNLAKEVGGKVAKSFYEVLSETAKEVGNVTSSAGPLTVDLLLETLEKMHIDFDEKGRPIGLTLVAHRDRAPSLEKILSEASNDPRYQALMERKKEEWRVRESDRKLVG